MKIEVGKTYKDREGNVVTIVSKDSYHSTSIYPYLGNNASSYMEDGRYRDYDKYHDFDLIEEVPAIGMLGSTWAFNNLKEEQTMKLEVGKSYKNRGGDIVYIAHYFHTHYYPYQDASGNTYLEDGTALHGQTSFRDLVEEHFVVEEPKQQEEQTMQDQIVTLNCTLTVTTAYGEPRLEIYPRDEGWRATSVCTVLDANFELVLPRDKIDTLYTDKLLLEVQTADEAYQKALDALDKANKFLENL